MHALEHASFFTAGIALWWPLIQPVPMRRRMTGMWPFAYIGAAKLGLAGLGLYLTWSTSVAYEHYETVPRIWGLTAVEDQNVGGAMMMLEQSVVLLIAFVVLFVQMLTQSEAEEQRRERLERAAAGLSASARAARCRAARRPGRDGRRPVARGRSPARYPGRAGWGRSASTSAGAACGPRSRPRASGRTAPVAANLLLPFTRGRALGGRRDGRRRRDVLGPAAAADRRGRGCTRSARSRRRARRSRRAPTA